MGDTVNSNENIEIDFIEAIRKKNNPRRAYKKHMAIFLAIFVASLIGGLLLSFMTRKTVSDELKGQISKHFLNVFDGCSKHTDYLTVIISSSSADLRYLLLVFTSGFTFFCKYAAAAMVAIRAFSVGMSIEFLFCVLNDGIITLRHPSLSFFLFTVFKILTAGFIIYLSVKSILFGYDFRRLRGRRSLILRSPVIYSHIFLFLTAVGFIIVVNSAYCAFSSLI
jgi:hypothetical protein